MPLFISSINSGSNGNCYYIGNENEAVLIDAGISCKETEKRMKILGLSIQNVKAIFVSHEHGDHVTGVPGISKKYQLPVYITAETYKCSNIPIQIDLVHSYRPHQPISIGRLSITAFPKFHDAVDPHSFIISYNHINIGVFTDIGHACKDVIKYFAQCHGVFLESNYCENMLATGSYPEVLKRRIKSDEGHLSNAQALDLFLKHKNKNLSHLILSHLSKNNNSRKLVESIFMKHAGQVQMIIASRYKQTDVYCIGETKHFSSPRKKSIYSQQQLSLF